MSYKINYSFSLRNEPGKTYSVDIPLALLAGKELNVDTVRDVVEEDDTLLLALLGESEMRAYDQMSMAPHLFREDLEWLDQTIRVIQTED